MSPQWQKASGKVYKIFFYFLVILCIITALVSVLIKGAEDTSPATLAILELDGKVAESFSLEDNDGKLIDLAPYGLNGKLEIRDGRARFAEMDCPDQICVKTSWIGDKTSVSVCMPNKAVLYLK